MRSQSGHESALIAKFRQLWQFKKVSTLNLKDKLAKEQTTSLCRLVWLMLICFLFNMQFLGARVNIMDEYMKTKARK